MWLSFLLHGCLETFSPDTSLKSTHFYNNHKGNLITDARLSGDITLGLIIPPFLCSFPALDSIKSGFDSVPLDDDESFKLYTK